MSQYEDFAQAFVTAIKKFSDARDLVAKGMDSIRGFLVNQAKFPEAHVRFFPHGGKPDQDYRTADAATYCADNSWRFELALATNPSFRPFVKVPIRAEIRRIRDTGEERAVFFIATDGQPHPLPHDVENFLGRLLQSVGHRVLSSTIDPDSREPFEPFKVKE